MFPFSFVSSTLAPYKLGLLAHVLYSISRLLPKLRYKEKTHSSDAYTLLWLSVECHLIGGVLSQSRESAGEWNLRCKSHIAYRCFSAYVRQQLLTGEFEIISITTVYLKLYFYFLPNFLFAFHQFVQRNQSYSSSHFQIIPAATFLFMFCFVMFLWCSCMISAFRYVVNHVMYKKLLWITDWSAARRFSRSSAKSSRTSIATHLVRKGWIQGSISCCIEVRAETLLNVLSMNFSGLDLSNTSRIRTIHRFWFFPKEPASTTHQSCNSRREALKLAV